MSQSFNARKKAKKKNRTVEEKGVARKIRSGELPRYQVMFQQITYTHPKTGKPTGRVSKFIHSLRSVYTLLTKKEGA